MQHPDRRHATTCPVEYPVLVDRERARCSAWYELFPRSCGPAPGVHGTLRDLAGRLPYVAEMGFDVLYLPPIHPIGRERRKGRNNALDASRLGDVGSPWAIGAIEGGHKSVLPELGTLADFRALVAACRTHGLELALDIAFQCAPDHPYVAAHPEWFRRRPDGTSSTRRIRRRNTRTFIPFDFESDDWEALWPNSRAYLLFWIGEGVRIFRVDNPHTKPFAFWEWVDRARSSASIPTCCSWPRRSRGPR